MLLYLPRNLALLAKCCATSDARQALAAVHVVDLGNGGYRCEATDGKKLVVIQGPSPSAAGYNLSEGEPLRETLVPGKDWTNAFQTIGNGYRAKKLPLGLASDVAGLTLAVPGQQYAVAPADGRFPDVTILFNSLGRPLLSIQVNLDVLLPLLQVVKDFTKSDAARPPLQLLFYDLDGKKPIGVIVNNEQDQVLDGLFMPLIQT